MLVDYTRPADVRVAQAALTSYWSDWSIDNIEKIDENDAEKHVPAVLSYGHKSVLEHVVLQFAVEGCSRACTHQLVRHRHMSFVQRSQRYITEDDKDLFVTPPSLKKVQIEAPVEFIDRVFDVNSDGVKIIPPTDKTHVLVNAVELYEMGLDFSKTLYDVLVTAGVPREDARYVLPQATKSKIFITMNLREFQHFVGLRTCERAQWEIRELAWMMLEEVVKHDDLRRLVEWAKIGPQCVQLGYCPERELMPVDNCVRKMKEKWNKVINYKKNVY